MKSKQRTYLKHASTLTKPSSVHGLEGRRGAVSGEACEMNPPNTTLEACCTVFVKEEFTESDLGLDLGCKSTDFASQPVKSEDGAVSREDFDSERQFQTNALSSPIKFSPQIKLERKREDDYEDQLLQSIHDTKTELPSQPSDIEMDSESGGKNQNLEDTTLISRPDFVALATESQSSFNSFTRIKSEGKNEDDTEVDPLHTIFDIKTEVSLELPDSIDHGNEDQIRTETSAPRNLLNCFATTPTKRFVVDQTRPSRLENVSARFTSKSDLHRHMRTRTCEKLFICSYCSTSFSQKGNLFAHMRTHSGEKPFRCSHCSVSFARKDYLNSHMRTHTGEKPFRCSRCSASFAHKGSLIVHLRRHSGDKPFYCSRCSACFARKGDLNSHMRTHTTGEKPFNCSHCSASFAQKSSIKVHMRTHTGEKPFRCSHCSASFAQKGNLTVHLRTHTGEKPFRCSHCSASFAHKGDFNSHMRTHTGEKPFRCSHCSASFAQKGSLIAHLRTHSGDKPFSCSRCSACFAQKGVLNSHMRTHTGEKPFNCSHCSVSFARKGNIKAHMQTHTGEKPSRCSHCSVSVKKTI